MKITLGQRFGRLTAIEKAPSKKRGSNTRSRWRVKCDCGTEKEVWSSHLIDGDTVSCGCLVAERGRASFTKHGTFQNGKWPPEYNAWCSMKKRCLSPKDGGYKNYGGRGITVCERWKSSYENFILDVGHRPSPLHSLDRIDNNKGYFPGNVRWATAKEQQRNRRSNRLVTIDGKTKCIAAWAEEYGIEVEMARARIRLGWEPKRAFTTPRLRARYR